ncbi:uncharacterized protein FSUBG_7992 [Fusarium subglutinans]|uniref:Uncharacterized protein n=1 Tax=Gibberella subglutinans TaxID=42677 RepID=A0A8H5UY85_GIBSU|nr:uncharacterized protein FSUBG_7992 [Fusarium subglutinans]KAF5601820.1 hypothetical protein FSUBG_7992 [Fusarium subglutinans]
MEHLRLDPLTASMYEQAIYDGSYIIGRLGYGELRETSQYELDYWVAKGRVQDSGHVKIGTTERNKNGSFLFTSTHRNGSSAKSLLAVRILTLTETGSTDTTSLAARCFITYQEPSRDARACFLEYCEHSPPGSGLFISPHVKNDLTTAIYGVTYMKGSRELHNDVVPLHKAADIFDDEDATISPAAGVENKTNLNKDVVISAI